MEDSNGEEDGSCEEEAPCGMTEAKEYMRQPSPKAQK